VQLVVALVLGEPPQSFPFVQVLTLAHDLLLSLAVP
jgi:hypothetical protein